MGVFTLISAMIAPIADLLGKVVTKEEDVLKIQSAISKIENEMASKFLNYETRLLEAQSKVITAETQGASWLQRNWRPITMLTFLILVVADTFGLTSFRLSPEAWSLLKIGLGGYLVSQSAEIIAPHISKRAKG